MMQDTADTRVIGYFAVDGDRLVLDQGACVVTGSEAAMERLLAGLSAKDKVTLSGHALQFRARKIRYGAIVEGMAGGGTYAFDKEAYERFRLVANKCGFDLTAESFAEEGEGVPLLKIKLDF